MLFVGGLLLSRKDVGELLPSVIRAARLLNDVQLARLATSMLTYSGESAALDALSDDRSVITLADYCRATDTPPRTARARAARGAIQGAFKEGRRWLIAG